jgi:hypothetical protein
MLAIAWGVLIYSFFIVSMNVLTTLAESERELYESIKRSEKKEQMRGQAEEMIFRFVIGARQMRKRQKLNEIKKGNTYRLYYTKE